MFLSIYLTHLRHNEFIQFVKNFMGILSGNDLEALKLRSEFDIKKISLCFYLFI